MRIASEFRQSLGYPAVCNPVSCIASASPFADKEQPLAAIIPRRPLLDIALVDQLLETRPSDCLVILGYPEFRDLPIGMIDDRVDRTD